MAGETNSSSGNKEEKNLCEKCGKSCVQLNKQNEFDELLVCENCCDQLIDNKEEPLFVIKTKIFSDLLTAPNLINKTNLLFDDMELLANLRNIKASKSIQTDFETDRMDLMKSNFDENGEDQSVEIYNFSKFSFDNELENVIAEEQSRKRPKSKSKSKYIQYNHLLDHHSLLKIGHKECVVPFFGVPPNKGWSWDLEKANNLAVGWKPGAIDQKVHKIMLSNKKAPTEVKKIKSNSLKKSRCDQSTSMSK